MFMGAISLGVADIFPSVSYFLGHIAYYGLTWIQSVAEFLSPIPYSLKVDGTTSFWIGIGAG